MATFDKKLRIIILGDKPDHDATEDIMDRVRKVDPKYIKGHNIIGPVDHYGPIARLARMLNSRAAQYRSRQFSIPDFYSWITKYLKNNPDVDQGPLDKERDT